MPRSRIAVVVGTRPEVIKTAPVVAGEPDATPRRLGDPVRATPEE